MLIWMRDAWALLTIISFMVYGIDLFYYHLAPPHERCPYDPKPAVVKVVISWLFVMLLRVAG